MPSVSARPTRPAASAEPAPGLRALPSRSLPNRDPLPLSLCLRLLMSVRDAAVCLRLFPLGWHRPTDCIQLPAHHWFITETFVRIAPMTALRLDQRTYASREALLCADACLRYAENPAVSCTDPNRPITSTKLLRVSTNSAGRYAHSSLRINSPTS